MDRYDWINWIDSKYPKKRSKKLNVSPKKSTKSNVFQKSERNRFSKKGQHIYWLDWLLWLNHLSHSFDLIESIHVLSNMIELIGVSKLYRFMVIESMHFHILPLLNWLIWHESYTSRKKKNIGRNRTELFLKLAPLVYMKSEPHVRSLDLKKSHKALTWPTHTESIVH